MTQQRRSREDAKGVGGAGSNGEKSSREQGCHLRGSPAWLAQPDTPGELYLSPPSRHWLKVQERVSGRQMSIPRHFRLSTSVCGAGSAPWRRGAGAGWRKEKGPRWGRGGDMAKGIYPRGSR